MRLTMPSQLLVVCDGGEMYKFPNMQNTDLIRDLWCDVDFTSLIELMKSAAK